MSVSDLLKKGKVHCPGCQRVFEVGPDLESISESAGNLLDKLGNFFGGDDEKDFLLTDDLKGALIELLEDLHDEYDFGDESAQDALARALDDGKVQSAISDFFESED